VNNESKYKVANACIKKLYKSSRYEIETIGIRGADSMTKGYNLGMQYAKGRYKIYLHQDVWIINTSFIDCILSIFQNNAQIGMLGVIGAKVLSEDDVWWESSYQVGKVVDSHTGEFELIDHTNNNAMSSPFEYVEAIDGLLMATQYDIPWREDVFDGWHFYDISQSFEFKKNHYRVAIPKQKEPWCIHDCGIVNLKDYELYREKFIDEYM
jgi:glycosyltransferase involved in cell wall biosynthesis